MIKKIRLKNFKCFDEIEIPFQKMTLLAGSNGSGKSTIIQSILVSAQSMISDDGYYITIKRSVRIKSG